MQYRYTENRNFEDYASGRVFYNQPGQPAFPVRLASEIFQRTLAHWKAAGGRGRCTIYDPVCGGAYWLAALAYLHWDEIETIIASDLRAEVLPLAERNLSLLTLAGLDRRMAEIETLLAAYQKESHKDALASAGKFRAQLDTHLKTSIIDTRIFQANAANSQHMADGLEGAHADLILADVPYGWHSQWGGENRESGMVNSELELEQTPVWGMLDALYGILKPGSIVAIAADKSQKVAHPKYTRLERFQLGRRRVFICNTLNLI
jgi:hypothetical protein